MRKLIVSPAPHVHGSESTRKIMLDVIIALAPSMLVAVYFFGLSAIQLLLVSVLVCVGLEYLIQKYMLRRQPTVREVERQKHSGHYGRQVTDRRLPADHVFLNQVLHSHAYQHCTQ